MRPKFLLDEQINPALAPAATRAGLDVTAVSGSELQGRGDPDVFRAAVSQGRILVTYNTRHVVPLLRDVISSGAEPAGLVLAPAKRFGPGDVSSLWRALKSLADHIERGDVDPSMGLTLST